MVLWLAAVIVGRRCHAAPGRHSSVTCRSAPRLPSRAWLTLAAGVVVGTRGFFTFATGLASANNNWMLSQLRRPARQLRRRRRARPVRRVGPHLLHLRVLHAAGLFASYLTASGAVRAIGALFDDPHGDFVLTAFDWAVTTMLDKNRRERAGDCAPAVSRATRRPTCCQTGEWAGLPDADYVVLAARKKAEWNAGAIILTSSDWYQLGVRSTSRRRPVCARRIR